MGQPWKAVAILMAGHPRTYNVTAPTLRAMVIEANIDVDFHIFALAYTGTGATPRTLRAAYGEVVPMDRLGLRFVPDKAVEKLLPKPLRSLPVHATRRDRARSWISSMFGAVAAVHAMARAHELHYGRRFDAILKLRFDLSILRPFVLNFDLVRATGNGWLPVVVPARMAPGNSNLLLRQLRTRPCDLDGRLRPTWCAASLGRNRRECRSVAGSRTTSRTAAAGPWNSSATAPRATSSRDRAGDRSSPSDSSPPLSGSVASSSNATPASGTPSRGPRANSHIERTGRLQWHYVRRRADSGGSSHGSGGSLGVLHALVFSAADPGLLATELFLAILLG